MLTPSTKGPAPSHLLPPEEPRLKLSLLPDPRGTGPLAALCPFTRAMINVKGLVLQDRGMTWGEALVHVAFAPVHGLSAPTVANFKPTT